MPATFTVVTEAPVPPEDTFARAARSNVLPLRGVIAYPRDIPDKF